MVLKDYSSVNLIVNSANDSFVKPLFAKEGDYNGRELIIQLTDNGVVKDTSGVRVNLVWAHDEYQVYGVEKFEPLNMSEGLFKIIYPNTLLVPGNIICSIEVISASGRSTMTRNFILKVEKSPHSGSEWVAPSSYIPMNEAIGKVAQMEVEKVGGGILAQMRDLSDEVRLAMTGGSVPIVGDNSVGTKELKDDAVDIAKVNTNLIDYVDENYQPRVKIENGYYIELNNGQKKPFTHHKKYGTIDKIIIPKNASQIVTNFKFLKEGTAGWATYDKYGNYLRGGKTPVIDVLKDEFYIALTNFDETSNHKGLKIRFETTELDTVISPFIQKAKYVIDAGQIIGFINDNYAVTNRLRIPEKCVYIKTNFNDIKEGIAGWCQFDNSGKPVMIGQNFETILIAEDAKYIQLTSLDYSKKHESLYVKFIGATSYEGKSVIVRPKIRKNLATLTNGYRMEFNSPYYISTSDLVPIPRYTRRIRHNFSPYPNSDGENGYAFYDENKDFLYGGKSLNLVLRGDERFISLTNYDPRGRHNNLFKINFIFDDSEKCLRIKKINFLGDSITYGTNPDPLDANTNTNNTARLKPFSETVCEITGALTNNYGWDGRTLGRDRSDGTLSVINLLEQVDKDADIFVILIGINDLHTTKILGEPGDNTDKTFYGCLDIMCKKLYSLIPLSKGKDVVVSTYFDYDREPNWYKWMEAIRNVCKKYGIPVADMMYDSRINTKFDAGELFAYRSDGLKDPHPKQAGQDAMGRYYANWLQSHFDF